VDEEVNKVSINAELVFEEIIAEIENEINDNARIRLAYV